MTDKKAYPSAIRPLPYYNIEGTPDDVRLAKALRQDFVPKVKRLLPGHHLGGQRHDFSISFIKRHKVKYPYFFRTDIRQFYPSVRHQDLIVGAHTIVVRDQATFQSAIYDLHG